MTSSSRRTAEPGDGDVGAGDDDTGRAADAVVQALDGAMVVVTAAAGGERDGCLVGFHSQCSIHPRQYAVWLSKANRTYEVAARADHVAVHLLARHQRDLAALFGAETGDEVDKFVACAWEEGPGGAPLLADAAGHVVLRRLALLDVGGDHACLVGEPVAARPPGAPRPATLRLGDVADLEAGHPADDPPRAP
ncbi:MAG TPA: flavin reductase family protein [Acidimicrobiales bacterium]